MLRKKVEIEGKSFTLGEATAGVLEDAQDAEAAMKGTPTDKRDKLALMRRVIAHCLCQGGFSISAEELAQRFTYSELAELWFAAMEVSGVVLQVKEGEAPGP